MGKKLVKYEEEIQLGIYCPYEKAHGVLKNVRQDFNSRQTRGESGFLTVQEYANHLSQY